MHRITIDHWVTDHDYLIILLSSSIAGLQNNNEHSISVFNYMQMPIIGIIIFIHESFISSIVVNLNSHSQ